MQKIPDFLLAKYDAVELVGAGGQGQVHRCESDGIVTAVKVLNELSEYNSRRRFKQEIEIAKSLDHPHIVKLLDAGEDDGIHWYESEFATESTFGELAGYLFYNDLERVKYFAQICRGVLALHAANIIHRDLKPSNILVFKSERQGEVTLKIADFGLSVIAGPSPRLTTTGDALGTGVYMAPERIQNPKIATETSDVFSLGITFLEACTGNTSQGENIESLSEVLKPIIKKMLRHRPEHRYQSVRDLLEDLAKPSLSMLLLGRELEANEPSFPIFSASPGSLLPRQIELLYNCTPESIEGAIGRVEETMERLGSHVYDHKAQAISSIPLRALKMLNAVRPHRLHSLMLTFANAVDKTKKGDFYFDNEDPWAWFLIHVFQLASDAQTKTLCLQTLVNVMIRFDTERVRYRVYHLIRQMDDPTDIQQLAESFREHQREELAEILDGVPHDRNLDEAALRDVLAKSQINQD